MLRIDGFILYGDAPRIDSLYRSRSAREVGYPGYLVAQGMMRSRGYADCNGVVLLDEPTILPQDAYIGLSHHDLLTRMVRAQNLHAMVTRFTREAGRSPSAAALIGGDGYHMDRNREVLEECRIPVVGEFYDGWTDPEEEQSPDAAWKSVIVPSHTEVLVCNPGGTFRLVRE
jgi:hypothetical protein